MRIHIHDFKANNDLSIWDIVDNLLTRESNDGIISVFFETTEKYVYVEADSSFVGTKYSGREIDISPIILDRDGRELRETDLDKYLSHEDFYHVSLIVETGRSNYISSVTALKHQYFVNFIPYDLTLYRSGMEPAIIESLYQ